MNPLVNVACLGFLPRRQLLPNRARAVGDRLVLVGGLTGRDGIGGVAFASKEITDRTETESRGAVQLGNPIMKEPLIHACLESFERGLVRGLKDLGGGGVASAFGELVHAGGFGSQIDLSLVPLRETGLRPWEVWVSESQERMVLDVRPGDLPELLTIFRRYDVPATAIGEVAPPPFESITWGGAPVAHLRVGFRVDPPPLHRRTRQRAPARGRSPTVPSDDLVGLFAEMVLAPDSTSREPIIRVYDHEVQGRTVIRPLHGGVMSPSHGDSAILQPRPESWKALAVTTATQPWVCRDDPAVGGETVVEEAARNLYAVGARPDAFTNCLNFGNPEDPRVLGDFAAVTRSMGRAAGVLGFAVPSGNVSFYNGGLGAEIPPTPVLMATGIVRDLRHIATSDLKAEGDRLYLLGRSRPELGGSLWARRRDLRGLRVPPTDPAGLKLLGESLVRAIERGLVVASHDVSDGGLAVALAEMAFGGRLGVDVDLATTGLPGAGAALVAEGASRFVVEVREPDSLRFERLLRGLPVRPLGGVTRADARLRWREREVATVPLAPLYPRWRGGLGLPG